RMLYTLEPTSHSAMSALSSASSSSCCSLRNLPRWTLLLHLLLASLHGDLFSFIQTVLQVLDGLLHVLLHALQVSAGVSLHFLFQTESLISAASLSFQRALQSVNCPLHIPLALLNLVKLKLSSEDLALFVLKRSLRQI
uniref:Uncharacterized protein n=1 Tax=Salarias fasciatus TaxID=181472 RepID=A0A672J611_SALFA